MRLRGLDGQIYALMSAQISYCPTVLLLEGSPSTWETLKYVRDLNWSYFEENRYSQGATSSCTPHFILHSSHSCESCSEQFAGWACRMKRQVNANGRSQTEVSYPSHCESSFHAAVLSFSKNISKGTKRKNLQISFWDFPSSCIWKMSLRA